MARFLTLHSWYVVSAVPVAIAMAGILQAQTAPYEPRILAHLVTWHARGPAGDTWNLTTTKPLRGPYDSLSADVFAAELTEMRSAGLAPLVSWSGPDSASGDGFLDMAVSVPDTGVPMAILYQSDRRLTPDQDGAYDFGNSANRERFIQDLRHLYDRYLSRYPERFFRQDGRFVIMVWPSHVYHGPFASLGRQIMTELPLYLVSTDLLTRPFIRPDAADIIGGFAAVSAYGIYLPEVAGELGGTLNDAWLERWQTMADAWDHWLAANEPQVRLSLPLEFAFNDSVARPGVHPQWVMNPAGARELSLRASTAMSNPGRYLPWATLASYNEHFEGSAVEPSDRFSTSLLDMLRGVFAAPTGPTRAVRPGPPRILPLGP